MGQITWPKWATARGQTHLSKGGRLKQGVLYWTCRKWYNSGDLRKNLFASVCGELISRFLPPDDERVRATVLAIRDELTDNGLVLRYRTDETDDGQTGVEGTFLICSFWLVSALSEIGEAREARRLCERLLGYASPLQLYGEELEASTGRHLGNYPQAFTHLALINAVSHVVADDGRG